MIIMVTGQPGSGKTYYTCRLIEKAAREGRFVATNVLLADDWAERCVKGSLRPGRARRIRELRSRVVYVESMAELAAIRLDVTGWEKKPEGRGIAVFDEAGEELDSRDWNADKDRRKLDNRFLKQHRKRGWDVYLIAQEAEQLDTRARGMAEYEVTLRNLKRYKVCTWLAGGFPLWPFGNLFLAVWRWRAVPGKEAMKREWFTLTRRIAGMYDTYQVVYATDESSVVALPAAEPPERGMATVAGLLAGPSMGERAPSEAAPVPPHAAPVEQPGHRSATLVPVATGDQPTQPQFPPPPAPGQRLAGRPASMLPPPIIPPSKPALAVVPSDQDGRVPTP